MRISECVYMRLPPSLQVALHSKSNAPCDAHTPLAAPPTPTGHTRVHGKRNPMHAHHMEGDGGVRKSMRRRADRCDAQGREHVHMACHGMSWHVMHVMGVLAPTRHSKVERHAMVCHACHGRSSANVSFQRETSCHSMSCVSCVHGRSSAKTSFQRGASLQQRR